jgi:hypothetical protein
VSDLLRSWCGVERWISGKTFQYLQCWSVLPESWTTLQLPFDRLRSRNEDCSVGSITGPSALP